MNENNNNNITNNNDKDDRYIFWLNDPMVLFRNENYRRFFPDNTMTRIEQLNVLTLFCIYALVLFLILGRTGWWLKMPIVCIIFIILMYYLFNIDNEGKVNELYRMKGQKLEYNDNIESDVLESGYIDSDDKLHIGSHISPKKVRFNNHVDYSYEDMERYKQATCRRSTIDNPFMNPLQTDFNNGDVPSACNVDDEDVQSIIDQNFDEGLYKDVDDLFDNHNSQRQFYTVTNTSIPNDQDAFAQWCYKPPATCKQDQQNCLRYEDLRYKSMI